MQVFKACFKVIQRNLPSMIIYISVFLALVMLITIFYQPVEQGVFQESKIRVAIFNQDTGHPFSDNLEAFLSEQTQVINVADTTEARQDALFHREVSYMLRIPEGFGEQFVTGERNLALQKTTVPDSYSSIQVDLLTQRYLTLSALYLDSLGEQNLSNTAVSVREDMQMSVPIDMMETGSNERPGMTTFYFTYLAYALISVMILCIGSTMLVFNQTDLRRRNQCSPVKMISFNAQLVLGILIFGLIVWLLMFLLSLPLGASQISPRLWGLFGLNALVFVLASLSMSFLVSQFIRSRNVMQAVANVLALGTSFISGVFVPMEFLGSGVQFVAGFTPTYWYIRAVRHIDRLPDFTSSSLQPLVGYMLIQLGFVVALLVIALAVYKQKRQSAS